MANRGSSKFCIHYRAMSEHSHCEKNVAYVNFQGMPFGERPCFKEKDESPRPGCEFVEFSSPEEVKAAEERIAERFKNVIKARAAIIDDFGGPWKAGTPGKAGTIDCPVCGKLKSLSYSVAGYNGHVHATCQTENCVRWME